MQSLPITVFTPTYNRAHTLARVFNSLTKQESALFEWLVVDDGSTDDSIAVLERSAKLAAFDVRVIRQPNGGKHRAHNTAVKQAKGELILILDSDDELVPGAVEDIWAEWCAIPNSERAAFAGLIGHSIDDEGHLVGALFSATPLDGRFIELVANNSIVGEKLPCYRTDLLQRFPFPELPGNNAYVPEGTVWVEIGSRYKLRCVNRVLRIYHRNAADKDAIMNRGVLSKRNAWGVMRYFQAILNLGTASFLRFPKLFAKSAAGYARYAFHSGYSVRRQGEQIESGLVRALWVAALPVAVAAWVMDRWRRS
jgi:glycosyltransferase involved in cell wall biosynthesis